MGKIDVNKPFTKISDICMLEPGFVSAEAYLPKIAKMFKVGKRNVIVPKIETVPRPTRKVWFKPNKRYELYNPKVQAFKDYEPTEEDFDLAKSLGISAARLVKQMTMLENILIRAPQKKDLQEKLKILFSPEVVSAINKKVIKYFIAKRLDNSGSFMRKHWKIESYENNRRNNFFHSDYAIDSIFRHMSTVFNNERENEEGSKYYTSKLLIGKMLAQIHEREKIKTKLLQKSLGKDTNEEEFVVDKEDFNVEVFRKPNGGLLLHFITK